MVNISDDAIRAFVEWFEKKYPRKLYVVRRENESAAQIICDDGFEVDFITFYSEKMGHNWYNKRHDPADTKTTTKEDQAQ